MNIEQLEQMLNELHGRICSMIEHPEQITIESVQQLKLPQIKANDDLINKLTEYSDEKIKNNNT